ncbi:MAG: SAM-dependent methyltransferase [Methanomicrobiales archaeon]
MSEENAKSYYDSDVDAIYQSTWGGENIHCGIYERTDDVRQASMETNRFLADHLDLGSDARVLDLGSGYGGLCRYLARRYGCRVTGLNISERQNRRAIQKNRSEGLDHLIDIQQGTFQDPPFGDGEFDAIVSQDALVHSPSKPRVIREACRILSPGGRLAFFDILLGDENIPEKEQQEIYRRIRLTDMATFLYYHTLLQKAGFRILTIQNRTPDLTTHYARVRDVLLDKYTVLTSRIPGDTIKNAIDGMEMWVDKSRSGKVCWGFFAAEKATHP